MKKIIVVILSALLLAGTAAVLCSAENEKLTATFYDVTSDEGWVYVVFNKPVKAPEDADEVRLALVGYGWPIGEGEDRYLRHILRTEFSAVEEVTDQIWRFSYKPSKTTAAKKEYKEWVLGNCIRAEFQAASCEYFEIRLFGYIRTADGSEELELDENTTVWDSNGLFEEGPSAQILQLSEDCHEFVHVATIYDLGVEIPGGDSGQDTSDTEPATSETETAPATDSAPESEKAKITEASGTEPSTGESGTGVLPIIVIACVAVLAVAAAVILLIRKKK